MCGVVAIYGFLGVLLFFLFLKQILIDAGTHDTSYRASSHELSPHHSRQELSSSEAADQANKTNPNHMLQVLRDTRQHLQEHGVERVFCTAEQTHNTLSA